MTDRLERLKELRPTADELIATLPVGTLQQIADSYVSLYPIVLSVKWTKMNSFQKKLLREAFEEENLSYEYTTTLGDPNPPHPAMIDISQRLIDIAQSLGLDPFLKIEFCAKGTVVQRYYKGDVRVLDEDETCGSYDTSQYLVR